MSSVYKFRIAIHNTQTVQCEITNPRDPEYNGKHPSGMLEFEANRPRIDLLVKKARNSQGASITPTEIEELGGLLFDALFQGQVRAAFWECYKRVRQNNQQRDGSATLSIEVFFEEKAEGVSLLASLPWEFMYAKDLQKDDPWLVYSPYILFSRFRLLESELPTVKIYPGQPLKVALLTTEFDPEKIDQSTEKLGEVDGEHVRTLLQLLATNSKRRIEFIDLNENIDLNSAINVIMIEELLKKHRPHIFHYIGHGQFKNQGSIPYGEIALRDGFGSPEWVGEKEFSEIFASYKPPVVLLQSCLGGAKSAVYANAGVGTHILGKDIPFVIAMQYEITNYAANLFATEFYNSINNGLIARVAVQRGRRNIQMNEPSLKTRAFATPMLFVNSCGGENPYQRDSELEMLWEILQTSNCPKEQIVEMLDNLETDLGRMTGISFPVSRELNDWLESLASLVDSQRWNIAANKWDYSLNEELFIHPLHWLIENIAIKVAVQDAQKLQSWNDQTLTLYKTSSTALKHLRQHLMATGGKAEDISSILLITIRSTEVDEEKLFIHADYYYEGAWRPQGDITTTRKDIEIQTASLLDHLMGLQLSKRGTYICFLVPPDLISFPFEHITNGLKGQKLGKIFPVVVRAYGRDQVPYQDYMDLWLDNWESVKDSANLSAREVMKQFDQTLLDSPDTLSAFSQAVFPVLQCAPSQDFAGASTDWTELLYENGTSVALWFRTKDSQLVNLEKHQERIEKELLSKSLSQLPETLRAMRKIASHISTDVGNYLVLLWDNPDQMPNYDRQASLGG